MTSIRLFRVFAVLLLCIAALGFYRGWFVLSSQGGNAVDNTIDVNLTVDPDKAKADARTVEATARDLTGNPATGTDSSP